MFLMRRRKRFLKECMLISAGREARRSGNAKVARSPRRMERKGLKQERAGQRGLGGEEHRSLPAAVGVPAEEEAPAHVLGEHSKGGA